MGSEETQAHHQDLVNLVESIGGKSRGGEFGKSRGGEFGESRDGERVGVDIIFVSEDTVSSFTLLPVWVCNKAP